MLTVLLGHFKKLDRLAQFAIVNTSDGPAGWTPDIR
jgi:hypothetical protein